jgi:PAS domain S-box-containing protein
VKPLPFGPLEPEQLAVRMAAIVDSFEDAIIGTDLGGTINIWNPAATNLFLYSAEEIIGQSILVLVPPELYGEQRQHLEQVLRGEQVRHYDTIRIAKGGKRIDVSVMLSAIRSDREGVIGTTVIARDLGARQRERAARARLAAIVESSEDAIVAKDLNGVITDWNAAAERIFGYSASEVVGRSILTIIPPDLQHEEPVILSKIRAGERIKHHVTQRMHKSGRRLDISLAISPIRDATGKIIGASKIARDVSEQRQYESVRRTLAAIVESSDDAIVSKNLDGIITSWNRGAERIFGYKAQEIVGHSVLRLIPPEYRDEEPLILSRIRAGQSIEHHETKRMRKSGEVFDISLSISPIKDETGRVVGASKIARDITERKAAERLLLDQEKLAAIARMSATLAHEVNNPLECIMNLSYLLAEDTSLSPRAREFATMLVREVQRAADITRQTLNYYREPKETAEVDVAATIEHVLNAKRKKLEAKNISVRSEFGTRTVLGIAGELRQVFENLIDNAIEALSQDGNITIRTHNGMGSFVMTISDNGTGISRETMGKLFRPFFTTKSSKGLGIGLWVSKGILERHGGRLRVRSSTRPDRSGSVFRITLPAENATESHDVLAGSLQQAS